ncbi:ras-related protein Rab-32B-like [Mytilus californianus]|uniref:ras-related protein Rab-32B-like n=1 Tax=Mytilus californianus TaxID=6549 RepID=UPI002245450E|nr:ras-related protein Rab-32B-like [Mytilus californianus]
MAAPTAAKEHLYKILVIGEFGVGKTSVIRRYTEGVFSPNYKLTIGVDFALKTVNWDDTTKINLQLWDIAGHERFGQMTRVYYKYAIAAIIVFDLTRPATFDSVLKWLNDVHSKVMLANQEPVPVVLLANKCDMENATVDSRVLSEFCQNNNIVNWFETSAKNNINIDDAMNFLIDYILKLPTESQQPNEHISLFNQQNQNTFEDSFEMDNKKTKLKSDCC